jgi:hypothetical protein
VGGEPVSVQSGQLSGGYDAARVAEQAAADLQELGFRVAIGTSGATVVLGPDSARSLVEYVESLRATVTRLQSELQAALRPPY